MLFAGKVGNPVSTSMCGLSLKEDLLLPRVAAWRLAFMQANRAALADMWADAQGRLRALKSGELKQNGMHFMQHSMDAQFLTCGEVHVVEPGSASAGFWDEVRHRDGAGSVTHLSMTIYGRRDVRCEQHAPASAAASAGASAGAGLAAKGDGRFGDGDADSADDSTEEPEEHSGLSEVVVPTVPGTVYIGQACGRGWGRECVYMRVWRSFPPPSPWGRALCGSLARPLGVQWFGVSRLVRRPPFVARRTAKLVSRGANRKPDDRREGKPKHQMTGCWHQVHHRESAKAELFKGKYAVTVQLRTSLFPRCRARNRNATPSPSKVFFTVAEVFRQHWAMEKFRLPSLAECEAAFVASSFCASAPSVGSPEPCAVSSEPCTALAPLPAAPADASGDVSWPAGSGRHGAPADGGVPRAARAPSDGPTPREDAREAAAAAASVASAAGATAKAAAAGAEAASAASAAVASAAGAAAASASAAGRAQPGEDAEAASHAPRLVSRRGRARAPAAARRRPSAADAPGPKKRARKE